MKTRKRTVPAGARLGNLTLRNETARIDRPLDGRNDGAEAVQMHLQHKQNIDLVVLDLGLPKLNGYDACARIRALPRGGEPKIIALTGWSQEEDKARAMQAGFDHHVVKPVEPRTVEDLIRSVK